MPTASWTTADSDLLESLLAAFGVPLSVPSFADVPCLTDPAEGSREMVEAGYLEGRALRVELRRTDATARGLVVGFDGITVDGQPWRVLRTSRDAADCSTVLFLGEP